MTLFAVIGALLLIEAVAWVGLGFVKWQHNHLTTRGGFIIAGAVVLDVVLAESLLYGFGVADWLILAYVVVHTAWLLNSVWKIWKRERVGLSLIHI